MQRLLQINGVKVDLDDKTAIGINLQSYDIKQPGKNFINVTNSFTIPITTNNLNIFGHPNSPASISTKIYKQAVCNYWVDNELLIGDARVRVDYISDRIGLFAFQKPSVWDELKLIKWPDFMPDFITWLQEEKGVPSKQNPFLGTFQNFLEPYTESTEGVFLPFYYGNMYNYEIDGNFSENSNTLWLRKWGINEDKADGGHFCIYYKTIFEYIEYKYGVNFLTSGGQAIGNIWDDAIAPTTYLPIRDLAIRYNASGDSFYFENDTDSQFLPLKSVKDKNGKTLSDCVNSWFQRFNIIKDEIEINNNPAIRLARFDDLKDVAEVKDFSGLWSGTPKYIPFINGYQQQNNIKFKGIYPEGDESQGAKVLTCGNLNLDASIDLFEIDGYISAFLPITGGVAPDLSVKESFKTFQVFVSDELTNDDISINTEESGNQQTATFKLQKAALYSLDSEYNFLDEILDTPKVWEWEKWLTFNDIKNLEFFKQYYIIELGASFFINKISGFNPQLSNKPTKIELIQISEKTPISPPDLNVWVDGVADPFTDGVGDYFF